MIWSWFLSVSIENKMKRQYKEENVERGKQSRCTKAYLMLTNKSADWGHDLTKVTHFYALFISQKTEALTKVFWAFGATEINNFQAMKILSSLNQTGIYS